MNKHLKETFYCALWNSLAISVFATLVFLFFVSDYEYGKQTIYLFFFIVEVMSFVALFFYMLPYYKNENGKKQD